MSAPSPSTKPFLPNLVAGALCAVVSVAFAGSFGGLVFGGPLAPFVGRAVLAALISSIIVMPIVARRGSFYFSLGGPESNPSAMIAFTIAAIAADVLREGGATPTQLVPTALMFLFLSSTGCGLVLYAVGWRRWGRYVRYLPHPVVGGFLAGSGYLLVVGSWKMLTGRPLSLSSLDAIAGVHPLAWITALVVAVALVSLTRLVKHFLVIPGILIGAMVAFHLARVACGLDVNSARQAGLLLAPLQLGDWTHVGNFPYQDVRWDLLAHHAKDFAAMTMVVIISLLLNTTSLELATGVEGDADRELKAIGLANIFIGFFGGMVAVNSFNRSMLNLKAGANSWWAAVCTAGVVLATVLFAPGLIGLMPQPVLTGLILFLGVNLVVTWIVESRHKMPWTDYVIVLAIVVIVGALGIVPGVVLGLVIACVSFVFTLSHSPSIRSSFSLVNRRSNVERPAQQIEILRQQGHAMRGFALQGFLFFGTTTRLLDEVRAALRETRFVLLDFRLVNGVDGSSTVALKKLKTLCAEAGITLVLTELAPDIEAMLRHDGVGLDGKKLRTFPDSDRGLEWCEDQIIASALPHSELAAALAGVLSAEEVAYLISHFERIEVAPGGFLLRQDDASDAMFIIEQGRVSIYLHFADATLADHKIRLRTYTIGTVVGEMGLYTSEARTADIVVDEPTRVLKLSAAQLAGLERRMPELAHKLHRFVVCSLAHRLVAANAEVRALM